MIDWYTRESNKKRYEDVDILYRSDWHNSRFSIFRGVLIEWHQDIEEPDYYVLHWLANLPEDTIKKIAIVHVIDQDHLSLSIRYILNIKSEVNMTWDNGVLYLTSWRGGKYEEDEDGKKYEEDYQTWNIDGIYDARTGKVVYVDESPRIMEHIDKEMNDE